MVRVLQIAPSGTYIGLEAGEWCVETGRGLVLLDQPSRFMGVFPLLELTYSETYQRVRRALEDHGISPDLAGSFPAQQLVTSALLLGSGYWKGQALRWLNELPASATWIKPLSGICADREWSQQLRRDAKRALAQLRQRMAQDG